VDEGRRATVVERPGTGRSSTASTSSPLTKPCSSFTDPGGPEDQQADRQGLRDAARHRVEPVADGVLDGRGAALGRADPVQESGTRRRDVAQHGGRRHRLGAEVAEVRRPALGLGADEGAAVRHEVARLETTLLARRGAPAGDVTDLRRPVTGMAQIRAVFVLS
jgi:hypothetical protein